METRSITSRIIEIISTVAVWCKEHLSKCTFELVKKNDNMALRIILGSLEIIATVLIERGLANT